MAKQMDVSVRRVHDDLLKIMIANWRQTGVAYFTESDLKSAGTSTTLSANVDTSTAKGPKGPIPASNTVAEATLLLNVRKAIKSDDGELIYVVRPDRMRAFYRKHLGNLEAPGVKLFDYRWLSGKADASHSDEFAKAIGEEEVIENSLEFSVKGPLQFTLGGFGINAPPGTKIVIRVLSVLAIVLALITYML